MSSGYYARGADVTFVAMSKGEEGAIKPQIHDLYRLNLSYHRHRITNMIILIRMSSLLTALGPLLGHRTMSEYVKLIR
jgi:hypothetical protein